MLIEDLSFYLGKGKDIFVKITFMELYYTFSVLIVLASFFAYLNLRFLKLPGTIGIMIIAMLVSVGIRLLGDSYFPATTKHFFALIKEFDFNEILMGAMLNFLLFAGALHVNIADLKEQKVPIMIYSTVSVMLSALIISRGSKSVSAATFAGF